jgi:hypothetical protein
MSAVTTTGFNTVDIGQMSTAALVVLASLMFIGAPTARLPTSHRAGLRGVARRKPCGTT